MLSPHITVKSEEEGAIFTVVCACSIFVLLERTLSILSKTAKKLYLQLCILVLLNIVLFCSYPRILHCVCVVLEQRGTGETVPTSSTGVIQAQ